MHKIIVAGLGPGSKDYILPISLKKIKSADIVIGGKRNLNSIANIINNIETLEIKGSLDFIIDYIRENRDKKIVMVVSGDTGFYSMLKFMNNNFDKNELEVIPGISSMQYLFSKIGKPWQDAKLGSLHYKKFDFIEYLDRYDMVGMLTDNINTPQKVSRLLVEKGMDYNIIVGENLSYDDENITIIKASKLAELKKDFGINVVIIDKLGDYDAN